ncbi:MAG: DUF6011 domain-containing protein, partial [Proteobacteria bacterium]|nr:DUF6011 domain-containing protein [Pseudomonadota bacterium]
EGFPGAGFKRCDRMYGEFGLPLGKIKRQVICLWNALQEDRDGHTWFRADSLAGVLQNEIGSATPNLRKALKIGVKAKWLTMRRDSDHVWWVAVAQKAANEAALAESIAAIITGPMVLPLFTEPLDGECDGTDPGDKCEDLVREILEQRELDRERAREFGFDDDEESAGVGGDESPDPRISDWRGLARVGRKTGTCQFCGRKLLKTESKLRGYGPVCSKRWGLPWGESEPESVLAESAPIELAPAPVEIAPKPQSRVRWVRNLFRWNHSQLLVQGREETGIMEAGFYGHNSRWIPPSHPQNRASEIRSRSGFALGSSCIFERRRTRRGRLPLGRKHKEQFHRKPSMGDKEGKRRRQETAWNPPDWRREPGRKTH